MTFLRFHSRSPPANHFQRRTPQRPATPLFAATPETAQTGGVVAAVGFDVDGTLVDHTTAACAAVRPWADERGWLQSEDPAAVWLALEARHFPEFTGGRISFQEQRRRRLTDFLVHLGDTAHGVDLDALFAEYVAHYEACWVPYPDVYRVLNHLRSSGLRLVVLTNGQQRQQETKLDRIGIRGHIDCVLTSDRLGAAKPSRRAFEALCATLGLPPAQVAYVGDDLHSDALAAASAGLRAIWLDRRNGDGQVPENLIRISTLDDLPRALAA